VILVDHFGIVLLLVELFELAELFHLVLNAAACLLHFSLVFNFGVLDELLEKVAVALEFLYLLLDVLLVLFLHLDGLGVFKSPFELS
jgi:hypothetical protein